VDENYDLIGMLTRHGMAASMSPPHMGVGDLMLRARDRIDELEAVCEHLHHWFARHLAVTGAQAEAYADMQARLAKVLDKD